MDKFQISVIVRAAAQPEVEMSIVYRGSGPIKSQKPDIEGHMRMNVGKRFSLSITTPSKSQAAIVTDLRQLDRELSSARRNFGESHVGITLSAA